MFNRRSPRLNKASLSMKEKYVLDWARHHRWKKNILDWKAHHRLNQTASIELHIRNWQGCPQLNWTTKNILFNWGHLILLRMFYWIKDVLLYLGYPIQLRMWYLNEGIFLLHQRWCLVQSRIYYSIQNVLFNWGHHPRLNKTSSLMKEKDIFVQIALLHLNRTSSIEKYNLN